MCSTDRVIHYYFPRAFHGWRQNNGSAEESNSAGNRIAERIGSSGAHQSNIELLGGTHYAKRVRQRHHDTPHHGAVPYLGSVRQLLKQVCADGNLEFHNGFPMRNAMQCP